MPVITMCSMAVSAMHLGEHVGEVFDDDDAACAGVVS